MMSTCVEHPKIMSPLWMIETYLKTKTRTYNEEIHETLILLLILIIQLKYIKGYTI